MHPLFVITARGGSKGLPGKNSKALSGKPLICYSIDAARNFVKDDSICVSTDDKNIFRVVEEYGLTVPFTRPSELASDTVSSEDALKHAWNFYKEKNKRYDCMVLLQPTTPFRKKEDVKMCLSLYNDNVDMVVSVQESHANPYTNLFEESPNGFLVKSKASNFERRQDCPAVYMLNGSVYVINPVSLLSKKMSEFRLVRKYVMDDYHSIDIDTQSDWDYAEYLLKNKLVQL